VVSDEDIAAMLIRYILFFLFFNFDFLYERGWVGGSVGLCVCVDVCASL
jgi:hypothetical protein